MTNGGVIGPRNLPTTDLASGVWSLEDARIYRSAGNWLFRSGAVTFDGTNDYMTRGADLTGSADSGKGLLSFWIKMGGGDGTLMKVVANDSDFVEVRRGTDNKVRILLYNSVPTNRLDMISTTSLVAANGWVHIAASWDLTVASPVSQLYRNGATDKNAGSSTATGSISDIDYTRTNWAIGSTTAGANKLNADLAQFYFAPGQHLDLSSAANLQRLISEAGKPANLGTTGIHPTGVAPLLYQRHTMGAAASDFVTNLGTGGGLTLTGTLAEASTSPTD